MAVPPEDLQPLSSAQLGIWFESFLSDPKPSHNIGELVEIHGTINLCALERSSNEKWKTLNATGKVNTSQSNEASENQEF
jgi:hypothetical protein